MALDVLNELAFVEFVVSVLRRAESTDRTTGRRPQPSVSRQSIV
ncbi:MAG: hypothetical protein ABR540_20625 [Acidimicrobiales bacterium]